MGMERSRSFVSAVSTALLSLSFFACDSAEEKECKGLVSDAETRLLSMNATDEQSVEFTLTGLREARGACEGAKMSSHVADIDDAISNTAQHLKRLKTGEIKPPPPPPTPEELERLAAEGDPSCPLGQGYQHPLLKKLVKCKGPRMVEMTRSEVVEYFAKFKFAAATRANRLRGMQNALVYEYVFVDVEGHDLPACLVIEAPASRDAAEVVSFATNVPVDELKLNEPVMIVDQEVALLAEKKGGGASALKTEVHHLVLGDCEAKEPMLQRAQPLPEMPLPEMPLPAMPSPSPEGRGKKAADEERPADTDGDSVQPVVAGSRD